MIQRHTTASMCRDTLYYIIFWYIHTSIRGNTIDTYYNDIDIPTLLWGHASMFWNRYIDTWYIDQYVHLSCWRSRASFICVTWFIHTCDMPLAYVCHAWFICVAYLMHMCGMTHSCVRHDSFMCETWLYHMRHDWFIWKTCLIHVKHDTFTCV